ncbi:MAG: hypothetical protein P8Y05_12815 [Deinococcales bacterium]
MLNKVPDAETEAYLRGRLARSSIEPVAVLHEDAPIARAWLKGEPLVSDRLAEGADAVVAALEAAAHRAPGPELGLEPAR